MKTLCTLWLMFLSLPMMAQTSAKPSFNVTDSSCITECKARVEQFRKDGNADRFQLDEEFFCHVSKFDKQKGASKLQLVNLGDDKVMSVTILQMQVNATNVKGQTGTLTADEPLDLLKDASFSRCRILNLDLGKGIFGAVVLNEVESLRLRIIYDGKEKIYVVGKEK
ncbi:hypothetical protein [Pseudobacter ginsenosidimutans]|uniref:Uncharacterized protein n=1 Tax=Pseudobacter ginsenosidimutans TaxID=661488 RepID=A0A4Q7MPR0_9BACT|nr:hypothetical protein [Pseudobacter ginsenosidimutans]QEC42485.1 hypothetical protein FSB84_12560 [Pseudobacter ginsenosidimutans]RZS70662.1 hypothetical protein EV199_2555 [Pseudobacter ginsenosidimutans]